MYLFSVCLICFFSVSFVCFFWFLCDFYYLVYSMCHLWVMCDLQDRSDFTKCIFSIYTPFSLFDIIVNSLLQSTIYVNYSRPNPQSRKRRAPLLLSSSSFETKSPSLLGYTSSTSFTPVNSILSSSGTESSSPFIRYKQAGNRRKAIAKEAARDGTYNPPG